MNDKIKLGSIITTPQSRDAVHVDIAPVVAMENLKPGQHVGLRYGLAYFTAGNNKVGIVDPFLNKAVARGQTFWMFLYPNTVTGLRHEWDHPAFSGSAGIERVPVEQLEMEAVEHRIREIAAECDLGYDTLMSAAQTWIEYGDYLTQNGSETWRDRFHEYAEEFWSLYSKIKGIHVEEDKRTSFFSCSC